MTRKVLNINDCMKTFEGDGIPVTRAFPVPEMREFDPFLLFDHFGPINYEPGGATGVPAHPHCGFEAITYLLGGEVEHKDSWGGKATIRTGDVQWMKTGSGIIHSEMPAMSEGKLHGFQLWINMPAKLKMNKPEYIHIDAKQMKVHKDSEKKIKIIAGKFDNFEGPVKGHNVEPIYFDVELEKDKIFNFDLPSTHNSFIYLIEG